MFQLITFKLIKAACESYLQVLNLRVYFSQFQFFCDY